MPAGGNPGAVQQMLPTMIQADKTPAAPADVALAEPSVGATGAAPVAPRTGTVEATAAAGPRPARKVNLLGLDRPGFLALCESLGQKPFRAVQLMRWIHQRAEGDLGAMQVDDFLSTLTRRRAERT